MGTFLPALGLGLSALAATVALASGANATGLMGPVLSGHDGPSPSALSRTGPAYTCYSQLEADNGVSIASQNFESSMNAYDSRGADDLVVDLSCNVRSVQVAGAYLSGSGPARSWNVTFYNDVNGVPGGGHLYNQANHPGVEDGAGNVVIHLRHAFRLEAGKSYFMSVQANMDFSTGGEWGWSTNNTLRGDPATWRNQKDGFGTGCRKYTPLLTCIPSTEGPDFAFALSNVG